MIVNWLEELKVDGFEYNDYHDWLELKYKKRHSNHELLMGIVKKWLEQDLGLI